MFAFWSGCSCVCVCAYVFVCVCVSVSVTRTKCKPTKCVHIVVDFNEAHRMRIPLKNPNPSRYSSFSGRPHFSSSSTVSGVTVFAVASGAGGNTPAPFVCGLAAVASERAMASSRCSSDGCCSGSIVCTHGGRFCWSLPVPVGLLVAAIFRGGCARDGGILVNECGRGGW